MPTLLEMPPEIMKEIVDFVGCPGIFTLRNVCHNLRNFVDNIRPSFRLQKLGYYISSESLFILCDQNDKKYKRKFDISDQDKFFKMLEMILKCQKSTLTFSIDDTSQMPGFYEKVNGILESRPSPLKVHKLSIRCLYQYQIHSILSTLESGTLEKIKFSGRDMETLELNEIVGLEQWKQAKSFDMYSFIMSSPIFLTRPDTKRLFNIYVEWRWDGERQWHETLGPFRISNNYSYEWRFWFPNSTGTLRVAHRGNQITFETLN
ncbi:hypothetical protein CAEBREN_12874 [Caenorhabditis brenneri]|uniref:F-box domain-containing protein n=1 Tax=Caenorhabditis brenneri TaxID=135651 RepID=G0PIM8_CAEBE|nr:hypothetical protein CAEBREN_12874 [Caenorhabditis brenneri]